MSSSCIRGVLCLPSSIIDNLFAVSRSGRAPPSHVLVSISSQKNNQNDSSTEWIPFSSGCFSCQLVSRDLKNSVLQTAFVDTSISVTQDSNNISSGSSIAPPVSSFLSPSLSQSFIDLPFAIDAVFSKENEDGKIPLERIKIVKPTDDSLQNLDDEKISLLRLRFAVPLVLVQPSQNNNNLFLTSVTLSCLKKERIDQGKILLSELGLLNNFLICGGGQGCIFQKHFQVMSLEGKSSSSCGIIGSETRIILNELPSFMMMKRKQQEQKHVDPQLTYVDDSENFLDYEGSLKKAVASFSFTAKDNNKNQAIEALLVSSPPGNGKTEFMKRFLYSFKNSKNTIDDDSCVTYIEEDRADNVFHILKLLQNKMKRNNKNQRQYIIFESEASEKFFLPCFSENYDPEDKDDFKKMSSAATQLMSLLPSMISDYQHDEKSNILLIFLLASSSTSIIPDNFNRTFFVGSHHVSLDLPNEKQRENLIKFFLRSLSTTTTSDDAIAKFVADNSIGYSVWDLKQVATRILSRTEANLDDVGKILKSHLPLSRSHKKQRSSNNNNNQVLPSSTSMTKKVLWSDIAGLEKVKEAIARSIIWPIHNPRRAKLFGINRLSGIMLHGPPGCAKTTIAKAICSEGKFGAFFHMDCASVLSAFVGEAEKTIRDVFHQARVQAPSVIFFDEIESFGGKRKAAGGGGSGGSSDVSVRLLATLLTEMDGINNTKKNDDDDNLDDPSSFGVCVIGATNLLHLCDDALLRPGRFDLLLEVPLPTGDDREKLFAHCLQKSNNNTNSTGNTIKITADVTFLAAMSRGCSGAEITGGWRDGVVTKLMNLNRNLLLATENSENEIISGSLDVTEEVAECIRKASRKQEEKK